MRMSRFTYISRVSDLFMHTLMKTSHIDAIEDSLYKEYTTDIILYFQKVRTGIMKYYCLGG